MSPLKILRRKTRYIINFITYSF
jgi:hypothetical protein